MSRIPTFSHTRNALRLFDQVQPHLDTLREGIQNMKDFRVWEEADNAATDRVHTAFYLDTRDRNQLKNCRLVGINTLREWAR